MDVTTESIRASGESLGGKALQPCPTGKRPAPHQMSQSSDYISDEMTVNYVPPHNSNITLPSGSRTQPASQSNKKKGKRPSTWRLGCSHCPKRSLVGWGDPTQLSIPGKRSSVRPCRDIRQAGETGGMRNSLLKKLKQDWSGPGL